MFAFFNDLFHGTPHHPLKSYSISSAIPTSIGAENSKEGFSDRLTRVEGRKRLRESRTDGRPQQCHITTDDNSVEVSLQRPAKKYRSSVKEESQLLQMVPTEVLQHVLSFCGTTQDRFAIQTTCKTFQRISNEAPELLVNVALGGDVAGNGGILQEDDTPMTASIKLTRYCHAGNLEAIYMLGMIKSYCLHDVDKGISLLKHASDGGYVRATYTLGLILRDIQPREARRYMNEAADSEYLPALQEVLSARDLKAKYGEPSAGELCQFLDPTSLNRLLGRHYVTCPHLRDLQTSHCWNPLCGRWAHRAHASNTSTSSREVVINTSSIATRSGRGSRVFASSKNQTPITPGVGSNTRVSRMKMCSRCCRAKYCSKLCQVYDWRSGRHKVECPFL